MKANWHGVNLGGWLVVERWITPSLFDGLKATDEYGLSAELGRAAAEETLAIHRKTFITRGDIVWLSRHGVNALRIPVGYWLFDDVPTYVGGVEYLDSALRWAEQLGMAVVIDLHGAPGSQNGKNHSGRAGKLGWGQNDNVQQTVLALERLAKRYAASPALAGIELLNEPSWRLGRRRLAAFYEESYDRVREHCSDTVAVIFHDAFRPKAWQALFRGTSYFQTVLDHHYYQLYRFWDKRRPAEQHVKRARQLCSLIENVQRVHPMIIGEWSVALPSQVMRHVHRKDEIYRAYGAEQLGAMRAARGWFYWSYKTEYGGPWSFRAAVENDWLPETFN